MGENQDDAYALRRAELDAVFHALPRPGTAAYWRRLEDTDDGQAPPLQSLPLEVAAHCLRERYTQNAVKDAERVFELLLRRIQGSVGKWAWKIAGLARADVRGQLKEDLEQECYMHLWEELTQDGPTFLLEHFYHALTRLQQHVAHDVMERAGEWQRAGVGTPTRVPRRDTDSIDADPTGVDAVPLADQIADPRADDAFERADLSDLLDLVRALPPDQRTIILDRFWRGHPQEETAANLHVSDRMVRYRLRTILRELGQRYHGGEEHDRV